jgi:hypothetical protein
LRVVERGDRIFLRPDAIEAAVEVELVLAIGDRVGLPEGGREIVAGRIGPGLAEMLAAREGVGKLAGGNIRLGHRSAAGPALERRIPDRRL